MVQRKSLDKLSIQADSHNNYVKPNKESTTVQNSSASQNPDVRNKGGHELKKMMKKSRSIKRSEFDILKSISVKRGGPKSRPDKTNLPANKVSDAAVTTPQKTSPGMVTPYKTPQVKIPEASPNYMKSTSSSIARKERSQVSPHGSKTSSDNKSPGRKDLFSPKLSSPPVKPAKTLTKTSSLRPVRTLTKTSSNKASRTSMKKSSGVALYTDQKVRKATCSSTIKDSKFPRYVPLNPGGTESEGTSVMKVCPYTYCSLNGHHHAHLPPLKHFMSARRRLLKTQKSMKLKNLSSVSKKPSGKSKEGIDTGQLLFNNDPAISDEDSAGSVFSSCTKEDSSDFFVEIYTQAREDTSKLKEGNIDDGNEAKKGFSGDPSILEDHSYSAKDGSKTEAENNGQYAESLPNDSSNSVISFKDNSNHNIDSIVEITDTSTFFFGYVQKEKVEGDDSAVSALGNFCNGNESGEYESDGSVFDVSGTDWEEGEVIDLHLDNETKQEPTFKTEDDVSNCNEEIPSNVELQVIHVEEFDGADQDSESESFSGINSEESNTCSSTSLEVPLPSVAISDVKDSEPAENPLEEPVHILLEYEKSTCSDNVEHTSELDEQEKSSEPEILHSIVPEDPDAGAEVVQRLPEPEDNKCQLKSQILESVDLETQDVASSKDHLSDVFPVPDANIDDSTEEVKDKEDQLGEKRQNIYSSVVSDENSYTEGSGLKPVENCNAEDVKVDAEDDRGDKKTDTNEVRCFPDQECPEKCSNINKHNRCKKHTEVAEEPREFNPRGPNFLPLEPEVDPETVDLRHQIMDERRNSEEWMVDYALRQAVRKLAPAQKRKVTLLIKAFETVSPMPKYEIHLPLTPTGFAHTRSMQACN